MATNPLQFPLNPTQSHNFPQNPYDSDSLTQPPSSSDTYMVGFVIVNIVGTQYYSGTISGREMVGLVREPLNPYDENAIKVLNTRGFQVGHLERGAAKVLAPLIDGEMIMVEGIVPKPPGGARGNRFRLPCQVHVFAKREDIGVVMMVMKEGGLDLVGDGTAAFGLSESVVVKERKNRDGVKGLDEIFRLVDESVGKGERVMALEPPKDVITSELFEHQKEGLGWLVRRENSDELPPFWEDKDGMYVNVVTNYQSNMRPEPLRGGIFADDMGMGKTLTLLSLIAFDKYGVPMCSVDGDGNANAGKNDEEVDGNESMGRTKKGKRGRPSKKVLSTTRKKRRIDDETGVSHLGQKGQCGTWDGSSKTTLVVCPPSVFSTWVTQLTEHTRRGSLKVYMYYGERTQDPEELKKFDLVLTTYSTLASETSSPVKEIDWWRIILDEAHFIKNPNAQQTQAVTGLKATRRWAVTGTPIQNSSYDLFSLMAFLRFDPFSNKGYWNSLVQRPLAQGNQAGLSRLQVIMGAISLRRSKDKTLVGLPSKSVETCFVELSTEERELYDQLELEAKIVVNSYIHSESVTRNYTTVLSLILRLRQICTDMALCPRDIRSLLPADSIEDVSNNPELLQKMVALLQDGEDFDCPICISPPTDIVITCCAHIFCRVCIMKTIKRTKPSCPMCRHPLSESDLYAAPPQNTESDPGGSSSSQTKSTSSKVSALLRILTEVKARNQSTKSVIFSQFQKMLLLLEEPLKASGFKTLRLDGSMNAKKRAQVIEEFSTSGPDSPTILLASLKASGTGINLTVASRVYLMEPWWNPAAEEQAMDRVHRIGQKEEVKIVRLIARNTIEERVLELQERKQRLAKEAFGKNKTKDKKEVNVDDLRLLMSL
ncbi:hypothetical protein Droror1_Dr00012855 [Drosera rotundifolia]